VIISASRSDGWSAPAGPASADERRTERLAERRWMARLTSDAPEPLLTEHLEGAQAILIFRVANLEQP
jgi:hypothetical protein